MRATGLLVVAAVLIVGALSAQAPRSPYAGEERRAIKSLSDEEIAAYLNGDGLGFAKAAELNRYPGPRHSLDMAEGLALSPTQRDAITAIRDSMRAGAIRLGREIVAREGALDSLFAAHAIDEAQLAAAVSAIARLQGELRAVHLAAHLATTRVLTEQQVARYQAMRGYGASGGHRH